MTKKFKELESKYNIIFESYFLAPSRYCDLIIMAAVFSFYKDDEFKHHVKGFNFDEIEEGIKVRFILENF